MIYIYGCSQPRELWFIDFNHVHCICLSLAPRQTDTSPPPPTPPPPPTLPRLPLTPPTFSRWREEHGNMRKHVNTWNLDWHCMQTLRYIQGSQFTLCEKNFDFYNVAILKSFFEKCFLQKLWLEYLQSKYLVLTASGRHGDVEGLLTRALLSCSTYPIIRKV